MEKWLSLIGLFLGIVGTFIGVRGTLKTSAAIIKQRWPDVTKSWQKVNPSWVHKASCHIAKKVGSDNPLDTEDYTVETFVTNFWAFILLCCGFLLQLIALLVGMGLICKG